MTTKEEYHKEMTAKLGETEVQIEMLMAQAIEADYEEYLTDIRVKQESAKAKLAELEETSGEEWQDLRANLDKTVLDVKNILSVVTADSG